MLQFVIIALLMVQQHAMVASEKGSENWRLGSIPLDKAKDIKHEVDATDKKNIGQNIEENRRTQDKTWGRTELGIISDIVDLNTNAIGADMEESTYEKLKREDENLGKDLKQKSIASENLQFETEGRTKSTGRNSEKRGGMRDEGWRETETGITSDESELEKRGAGIVDDSNDQKLVRKTVRGWFGFKNNRKNIDGKEEHSRERNLHCCRQRLSPCRTPESGARERVETSVRKLFPLSMRADDISRDRTTQTTGRKADGGKRDEHQTMTDQVRIIRDKKGREIKRIITDTEESTYKILEARDTKLDENWTHKSIAPGEKIDTEENTYKKLEARGIKLDDNWTHKSIVPEEKELGLNTSNCTGQRAKCDRMQVKDWEGTQRMGITLNEKLETKDADTVDNSNAQMLGRSPVRDWSGFKINRENIEKKENKEDAGKGRNWRCWKIRTGRIGRGVGGKVIGPGETLLSPKPRADDSSRNLKSRGPSWVECKCCPRGGGDGGNGCIKFRKICNSVFGFVFCCCLFNYTADESDYYYRNYGGYSGGSGGGGNSNGNFLHTATAASVISI